MGDRTADQFIELWRRASDRMWDYIDQFCHNERGAVGEEDELTAEDKTILGEEEETSEKEGEKKVEEKEEVKREEEVVDDKGPVPYERFKEKLDRAKEADEYETKLDLLKTDPDEYYNQYPDEKAKEEAAPEVTTTAPDDIWNMLVKGGEFDGQTLGAVYDQGGAAARYALGLYNQELDSVRSETETARSREAKIKTDTDKEIDTFAGSLAKDMYQKEPEDKLSKEETETIDGVINETLDWMEKTNRGFGNIVDAYFLKNKDRILAGEQIKGVSNLIKSTQTDVSSISNKKDIGTELTGYEGDMGKSAEELAAKIENMTDAEATKYLADAPQKLRDKHPKASWG